MLFSVTEEFSAYLFQRSYPKQYYKNQYGFEYMTKKVECGALEKEIFLLSREVIRLQRSGIDTIKYHT